MSDVAATPAGIAILNYHSIASSTTASFRRYTVDPLLFEEHIAALIEADYKLVTAADIPALLDAEDAGDCSATVAISIDDGLADVASGAAPALARHRVPATLFVPTAYVGGKAGWLLGQDAERPILGWSAIEELAAAGLEIGSHGHLHLAADINKPALVQEDAVRSRGELEAHLGRAITSYAYPFGYWTPAARRAVQAAGFAQACAVMDLPALATDDRFALPRLQVGAEMTAELLLELVRSRPIPLARRRAEVGQRIWRTGHRWGLWGPEEAGVVTGDRLAQIEAL
jgi:peptidoglycan/xylan/chitin deacetylase (PgdA/CDA1 family)